MVLLGWFIAIPGTVGWWRHRSSEPTHSDKTCITGGVRAQERGTKFNDRFGNLGGWKNRGVVACRPWMGLCIGGA